MYILKLTIFRYGYVNKGKMKRGISALQQCPLPVISACAFGHLLCWTGHLKMAKFLLAAGADQEHKTDEMHTALMEASMDGHVDVARLLLDSGAQVCTTNLVVCSNKTPSTYGIKQNVSV